MNGILNILKPPGMTSFDIVGYLRGVCKTKKIGHTGTLDPAAVGVLPICIGNATKAIEFMMDKDKLYRAELTLGVVTDTQDSSGQVLDEREVKVSEAQIREVMAGFVGRIMQVPPMYSAVKVNGKKLYELAREGVTVEREAREIEIYSINIINIAESRKVIFDVACSKGTYIRTLCADVGERLGCGGHMSFLVRLEAGVFDIESAVTLEEVSDLANAGKLTERLIRVDEVFKDYDKVNLDISEEKKLMNGMTVPVKTGIRLKGTEVRAYNNQGDFIALCDVIYNGEKLYVKSKKVFKLQ
ncbi:MAG: tRNA pseudouridine(55) synthase TruB [Clostridia bacterium]|nr:tRNA pseudouridine(55) synthase TruB [Clostridia bacterium]